MSHQCGYYDHSRNDLNIVVKEVFTFLDPCAELKYQKDMLAPQCKNSTQRIQEELMRGEVLLGGCKGKC